MNRQESRQILNRASRLIDRNVRAYAAGRISYVSFGARNRRLHDAIERAGQRHTFARRWRSGHSTPAAN